MCLGGDGIDALRKYIELRLLVSEIFLSPLEPVFELRDMFAAAEQSGKLFRCVIVRQPGSLDCSRPTASSIRELFLFGAQISRDRIDLSDGVRSFRIERNECLDALEPALRIGDFRFQIVALYCDFTLE